MSNKARQTKIKKKMLQDVDNYRTSDLLSLSHLREHMWNLYYLLGWKCRRVVSIQTEVQQFIVILFLAVFLWWFSWCLYQILDWRDLYFSKFWLPIWMPLWIPVASRIFHGFDEVASISAIPRLDNNIFLKNSHGIKCLLFNHEISDFYAN